MDIKFPCIPMVSDATLWSNIFGNPFSENFNGIRKDGIVLKEYFDFQEIIIFGQGTKYRLCPTIKYYEVSEEKRKSAFIVLSMFLFHYKKPFSNLFLEIPNHSSVIRDNTFSPLCVSYYEPEYLWLAVEKNRFIVCFIPETYKCVYQYAFGILPENSLENRQLNFSFNCFRGVIF